MILKHLSLFSGVGCTELGMMLAGLDFRTVAYCEIDKYCQRVLTARMADGAIDAAPIFDDVTKLTADMVGQVDIITGGFPCQDISCAGKGAGLEGSRSGLFFEIIRLVRTLRPRYILLENVSALLNRGLDRVLGTLAETGYDAAWTSVKASDVGAPHRRERIFILCELADVQGGQSGVETERQGRESLKRGSEKSELVDSQSDRTNGEAGRGCSETGRQGITLPRQLERSGSRPESETRRMAETPHGPNAERGQVTTGNGQGILGENANEAGLRGPKGKLGDTEHAGRHAPEVAGSTEQGSDRSTARAEKACELEGSDQPRQREEMADVSSQRVQRVRAQRQQVTEIHVGKGLPVSIGLRNELWPRGYGPEQHGWEPARLTLGNARSRRQQGNDGRKSGQELADGHEQNSERTVADTKCRRSQKQGNAEISGGAPDPATDSSKRKSKPRLGRNSNGRSYRVDRLKALGNGIVPQQMARAIVELFEILNLSEG